MDCHYRQKQRLESTGDLSALDSLVSRVRTGMPALQACDEYLSERLDPKHIDDAVWDIVEFLAGRNEPHYQQIKELPDFRTEAYAVYRLGQEMIGKPPEYFWQGGIILCEYLEGIEFIFKAIPLLSFNISITYEPMNQHIFFYDLDGDGPRSIFEILGKAHHHIDRFQDYEGEEVNNSHSIWFLSPEQILEKVIGYSRR